MENLQPALQPLPAIPAILLYLSGAATMGFLVAGAFFLRFWTRTKDRLFISFACAFWLLAINQSVTAFAQSMREEFLWAYGLRLIAFGLIIAAIVGKNLRGGRG
ncbi:MAG TPA: DUF5985 family protein [Azospirillaceae bacterium]|nr:DUF5985 family protein [Azospirillaceae bacterium]